MKIYVSPSGIVDGYYCTECSGYNDILNIYCIYCSIYRDRLVSYKELEWITAVRRGIAIHYHDTPIHMLTDSQRVDLFKKFFGESATKVASMSLDALDSYIDELETVVIEAKASLQAATHNKRERVASLSQSERDKLITKPEITGSEALSVTKKRKEKLTKADRLIKDYMASGIPEAEAREMVSKIVKVDETKQQSTPTVRMQSSDPMKRYVFNGNPTPLNDDGSVDVKAQAKLDAKNALENAVAAAIANAPVYEPKPIDFASLDGLFAKKD